MAWADVPLGLGPWFRVSPWLGEMCYCWRTRSYLGKVLVQMLLAVQLQDLCLCMHWRMAKFWNKLGEEGCAAPSNGVSRQECVLSPTPDPHWPIHGRKAN